MTIRERQILSGMDIKARTGDELALKAAIANAQKDSGGGDGGGGGGSGSGITVIECELIADYDAQTYALTHADQLKAALDDMAENPTHGFNYAVYFRGNAEPSMLGFASVAYIDPLSFGFMTIGTEIVAARIDNSIGAEEVNISYQATNHYSFRATDIDENGTATLMYIGD